MNNHDTHLHHYNNSSPLNVPQKTDQSSDLIGLSDLIGVLRRRFRLISSITILVFILGVVFTSLMTPKYTATSLLKIQPASEQIVSEQQSLSYSDLYAEDSFIDSEIEVLKSPEMIGRLLSELNLIERSEWNADLQEPGPLEGLKSLIKSALPSGGDGLVGVDAEYSSRYLVLNSVSDAITVRRSGLTYIINLSATSEDPKHAAELANMLAQQYIDRQVEGQFSSAERANQWLTDRLDQLRSEVQQTERAAQEYRVENGLLTADGISLVETQISDVQTAVVQARADLAEKMARYNQINNLIRSGSSIDSIASVLNSEVIRELRVKEADVAQRQADLENLYGPKYPEVEKVRLERRDIQAQIEAEVARIAQSFRNEADVVRARLRTLENNLRSTEVNLADNNRELVRLNELETEAKAARSVYETFLERYHEIAQQGELASVDVEIVSPAQQPLKPSSPNLMLNAALSLVMGGMLSLGIVLFLEVTNNVIMTPEDVEKKTGLPTVATIPELKAHDFKKMSSGDKNPVDYLINQQMSAYAEAFRIIRTTIRHSKRSAGAKLIGVTSSLPGDGKTTISISLARTAALSGQKVLVIDCDLRRASCTQLLGLETDLVLSDILENGANWREGILKDPHTNLHVLPSRPGGFTPHEIFVSSSFEQILEEAKNNYDLVILDCAPVLAVAEVRDVLTQVDAVLFSVLWMKSEIKAVNDALTQLERSGVNLLGAILNRFDYDLSSRYGYDGSKYYKKVENYYSKGQ